MKQKTRDNLIYLAVGLGFAVLLAADAFYSDSHDLKMWIPSRLAFNAVVFMGVLAYMVARETQKARATVIQMVTCILIACIIHVGIVFAFPQIFAKPFAAGLWLFIVLELFIVVRFIVQLVLYLWRIETH